MNTFRHSERQDADKVAILSNAVIGTLRLNNMVQNADIV